jgi:alpha-1,3-rhamnosyl/mannosyltransferase
MALRVPVVASDAASLPEIVGDAGVTVPPMDVEAWTGALRRVLQEPGLRTTMTEAGVARAAGFTWLRAAEATAAVYKGVAGQASRPALEVGHGRA